MKKFKLPEIHKATNKSIRFPDYLIDKIETILCGTSCCFSAFVIEAVKIAVDSIEEENIETEKEKSSY